MKKILESVEDLLKLNDEELNEILCDAKYNKANLREQLRRSLLKVSEYKKAFEYERNENQKILNYKEWSRIGSLDDFKFFFKKLLWSDELLSLLPGCGWNDGGCRSLMKAVKIWLDDPSVETYQIVSNRNGDHSEHALIRVGNWFLDGDGVSDYKTLNNRWLLEERLPSVTIRPFNPEEEVNASNGEEPFYIEDEFIQEIVKMLELNFDKHQVLLLLEEWE